MKDGTMTESAPSFELIKSLYYLIECLEEVALHEIEILSTHRDIDLDEITRKKSQYFLEITKVMRFFKGQTATSELISKLAHLNKVLELNRAALENHITAVQEISALMTHVIDDANSDGTYTRPPVGASQKRSVSSGYESW